MGITKVSKQNMVVKTLYISPQKKQWSQRKTFVSIFINRLIYEFRPENVSLQNCQSKNPRLPKKPLKFMSF